MLILARRPGERVVIGGEILVTVMEVSGSTVRLGIEAPQGISIYREEIWLAVEEENRAAAAAAADALPSSPLGEVPSATESRAADATESRAPDVPESTAPNPPADTGALPSEPTGGDPGAPED